MVELTATDHQYIDKLLYLLKESWEELPQVAFEIDQWDIVDRVDFLGEWPLEEGRLRQLEQYVEQGVLSQDQLARYEELKGIIEANRPILRELQASEATSVTSQENQAYQNVLVGLVRESWKESEEQGRFHPQAWFPTGGEVSPGSGFAACFGEVSSSLSDVCTSALNVVLPSIEANAVNNIRQFLVDRYALQDTVYTALHDIVLSSSEIVRSSFDAYLEVQQEAADSYQAAVEAQQELLNAQQEAFDSYLEAQQETVEAVQSMSFRGAGDNFDYRSRNEPRKKLGLASAA